MHMRIESGCCGRETVSFFANYASSKGVSMETVETPLDPPLDLRQKLASSAGNAIAACDVTSGITSALPCACGSGA